MFSAVFEPFAMLCTSVWISRLSGSPMHDSALLAGKSGVTDIFAGIFELSESLLCACMPSASLRGSQVFLSHLCATLESQ